MEMGVISEAIKLATAPVFLLTGVGGILNVLGNRLARVIDRARWVQSIIANSSQIDSAQDLSLQHYFVELVALKRRKLIINIATATLVLSAVLIAMTVIELSFSVSIELNAFYISKWVPVTFIGSFISLVGSCILYLVEILYASYTISFDPVGLNDQLHK
jgi:hypothetical protein